MLNKPIITLFFFEKDPSVAATVTEILQDGHFNLTRDKEFFFSEDTNEIVMAYKSNLDQKNPSVLVFVSLEMPGSLDLIGSIKALYENAFVIAFSNEASEDKVLGAKIQGAQGFIVKPFTPEIMDKYIQRYFQDMIQRANQKHFESVKNRLRWTI